MMSTLKIPSVTIDDLKAFKAKHFHIQSPDAEYKGEEEDGLGYYPDGVKRTLTDEQIRIFRHSEIHSLLRERELQQESDC